MKKFKQFISSPKGTLAVFGTAIILLLFSSVGGARAALTYYSENHMTEIQTQTIDVELLENGKSVPMDRENSGKGLLQELLPEDGKFEVGRTYEESLSVQNTGEIDQYVRVTVYKYWVDEKENKVKDVYPGYIELPLVNESDWWVDTAASTQERTVIYYRKLLKSGETAAPFAENLKVNEEVGKIVTKEKDKVSFDYQGLKFQVRVDVDAVQTHNAADAILSSWGKNVTVNEDGSLNF